MPFITGPMHANHILPCMAPSFLSFFFWFPGKKGIRDGGMGGFVDMWDDNDGGIGQGSLRGGKCNSLDFAGLEH